MQGTRRKNGRGVLRKSGEWGWDPWGGRINQVLKKKQNQRRPMSPLAPFLWPQNMSPTGEETFWGELHQNLQLGGLGWRPKRVGTSRKSEMRGKRTPVGERE